MPEPSQRRSSVRLVGWALLLLGVLVLVERFWRASWGWGLLCLGVLFVIAAFRGSGDNKVLLFPGVVFLVTGGAILTRQLGLADFPLWYLWPIFLGSLGLGFILLWTVSLSGWWVFFPGGLFLFLSGIGLAARSWHHYLRWLRRVVDWWPILLLVIGLLILVGWWRSRSEV